MPSCQIRDAQPSDAVAVSDVYRRSSLSNAGDRDHALGFYLQVGFVVGRRVQTRFGAGTRMSLDLGR